jgi:nitroreductase
VAVTAEERGAAPSDGLFDVVLRQRACRVFRPDPVDSSLVARVLHAATRAPSAENTQPWVFVVVRDADRRGAIGTLTRQAWEGGGRAHSEGRLAPMLLDDVERGAVGGIAEAPVLVVVAGDERRTLPGVLAASVFPAVQNLLLAATALGLGSALTTLPTVFGDELADAVGLPPGVRAMAVVPLGWPARALGRPRREPLGDHAFAERFGTPLPGAEDL